MMKEFLPSFAVVAFLGLSGVAGATSLHDDPTVLVNNEVLRLPFHEIIKCLNSSTIEEHWLTSGVILRDEMGPELDKYLHESFTPDTFIGFERLNIGLHESAHANKDESSRSFLRQQDYMASHCDLELEIGGRALFAANPKNATVVSNPPKLLRQRSLIYARVAKALADNHDRLMTTAQGTEDQPSMKLRRSLLTCPSTVKSKYSFTAGEFMCSADGPFFFGFAADGDLGIWKGVRKVWSAGSYGDDNKVTLQPDGNLVVRDKSHGVLWASRTNGGVDSWGEVKIADNGEVSITNSVAAKSLIIVPELDNLEECATKLEGIARLQPGQHICSQDERYSFGLTVDGVLGIFFGPTQVWSAGTCKGDGTYAHLQADGNFVVYSGTGDVLWEAGTGGSVGDTARITIGSSGIVTIDNPNAGKTVTIEPFDAPPSLPPTPLPTPKPSPSPTTKPPTKSPTPPPTSEPPTLPSPTSEPPTLLPCRDPVQGGVVMAEGEFICSPNGIFKFGLANDGDLALYEGSREIWSASTCCTGEEVTARLQMDGNLVVKTSVSDEIIWTSRSATQDTDVVSLTIGDDGLVAITDSKLGRLWSSSNVSPPQPTKSPTAPVPSPTAEPPIFKAPPLFDPSLLPCRDPVQGGVVMVEGEFVCSPNGLFKFGLTNDGDLALYEGSREIWSASTCCTGEEVTARLQMDGNLVVKTSVSDEIIWTSETATQDIDAVSLIVGDDGVVTITDTFRGHIWSSAVKNASDRVTTDSLVGKVMAGYQGWFMAKGDGGMNQWVHWSRPEKVPSGSSITIDAWPDMRELDDDELYPTEFTYKDGSPAGLYSSYKAKTTERHTRWMKDYGVHGVFVQRFIGNARAPNWTPVIDQVLGHVRSGAEKYGRTFVNMYDIGNGNEETIVEDIINDWKHLVDDEHITKSNQYLYHRGRPLVAIWGFGFYDRLGRPEQVVEIIDWFQNKAEDKYKATLMGGVPTGWRDLSRDSQSNAQWASIYRSYDVISPWAVGRLVDVRTANYHRTRYTEPDLAECASLGIDYLPVVFPGFSFHNLKPKKPFNEIPRNGGTFMWHQMYNAVAAGSKMIYVAMFDEVDEATAIYKIADNQQQTPREGEFLAADYDGYMDCPGDWYLNITGTVAGLVQSGIDVPLEMPAYP